MLENQVYAAMRPFAQCRWLCGFSGGADSTALLLLLKAAARELGSSLAAVHFEHGLRGEESLQDAAFCRDFAAAQQIPLQVISLQVRENRRRGEGIEAAARRLRMQTWEKLSETPGTDATAKRYKAGFRMDREKDGICTFELATCSGNGRESANSGLSRDAERQVETFGRRVNTVVLLAHHADDAAENLLLRMARGGNLSGLLSPGFRTEIHGVIYLRPLLDCSKREITAYLQAQGVTDYCLDSSNADCRFARNRIRNRVIPELKQIHSGSEEGIRISLRNLRCDENFLEQAAEAAFAPWANQRAIPLTFWRGLHPAMQVRCLRLFLAAQGAPQILPSGAFFRRFARLLEKGAGQIPLEKRFLAAQGGMISLTESELTEFRWRWREMPEIRLANWLFRAESCPSMPPKRKQTPAAFYFDADLLPDEVILRNRRCGDVLESFDRRTIPLKKLFTDAKLSAVQRTAPLVLEAPGLGLLGVLLLRRGAAAQVTASTRTILRISVE